MQYIASYTEEEPKFKPIKIELIIESEHELNYLYALSNTNSGKVVQSAKEMGISIDERSNLILSRSEFGMEFFRAMEKIYEDFSK